MRVQHNLLLVAQSGDDDSIGVPERLAAGDDSLRGAVEVGGRRLGGPRETVDVASE